MKRRLAAAAGLLAVVSLTAASPATTAPSGLPPAKPGTSLNFQLVGHTSLFNRGMNAALAIYRNFVYVGDRTDSSDAHAHPGVMIVSIANPARPRVVGRIGPPLEDMPSQTSRELRVWPQKRLLMVMNFRCSTVLHDCVEGPDKWDISFYDLTGRNAAHPKLISRYHPKSEPHEMYLWVDPKNRNRALLYLSTPNGTTAPGASELTVTDISRARQGKFREIAHGSWTARFKRQVPHHFKQCGGEGFDVFVHSMGLNAAGTRAYLAYWCGQMLIVDTSEVARGVAHPHIRLITPIRNRPTWSNPHGHSAVKVPGRPYLITTDEVYGGFLTQFDPPAEHDGCPWGWARVIDIHNERQPRIIAQYKIKQNTEAFCRSRAGQNPANNRFTSYASHNPTVLPDLAFIDWHSGGLQAFTLDDPANPTTAGFFLPTPLRHVATEDPALSSGNQKVVFWSYPIIRHGLIYAVDIRNGLYILRYSGPHASEVRHIGFLEGNSNLGAFVRLDRPS